MFRLRWLWRWSAPLAALLLMLHLAAAVRGQSAPSLAPVADEAAPVEKDSRLTVELFDGSTLKGHPVGASSLRLTTSLGELEVPLAKIAGVQFKSDPNATLVLLPNGDRMSGKLMGGPIALRAAWGEVSVKLEHVAAIGSSDTAIQKVTVADRMPDGRIERRVVVQVRLLKELRQHDPDTQPAGYQNIAPQYRSSNGASYGSSYQGGQPIPSYPTPTPVSPYDASPSALPPAYAPPEDPDDVPAPVPN